MGLSKAYVRKVGNKDNTEIYCSYIKAGQGFKDDHWHDEIYVEQIIKVRIEQHRQIKIAGNNSEKLKNIPQFCGEPNAYVEIYEDGEWKHSVNENVMPPKNDSSPDDDKYVPGRGASGNEQFGHGSTGSHDRFNNARSPIVAQPGRCLPHLPKDENNATRGGHNDSQREPNQLPGDTFFS